LKTKVEISLSVEEKYFRAIQQLPWNIPISEWENHGEHILKIKCGVSRHTVIFVKSFGYEFAIKEISPDISRKEILNYEKILLKAVHTLVPVGFVIKKGEPIVINLPTGIQYENSDIAYTITLLAPRVLPDSTLFGRSFQEKNQIKIWDSIVELFVDLHSNNIYWGDASLANLLIRFDKDEMPDGKRITKLRAVLADAETIEVYDHISDSMRFADIEFFFESMAWINEDLKTAGIERDEEHLDKCKKYIREKYEKDFEFNKKVKLFEKETGLLFRKTFSCLPNEIYIQVIEKQIQEHRWYLGEKKKKAVGLKTAAKDWYSKVYCPIKQILIDHNILSHFPGKNLLDIYIGIMQHKYYLSEKLNKDVGAVYAMEDYFHSFGEDEPLTKKILSFGKALLKIIGVR
jgi:hypothetical protein